MKKPKTELEAFEQFAESLYAKARSLICLCDEEKLNEETERIDTFYRDGLAAIKDQFKKRQLKDRVETYSDIIKGRCICGIEIHKVVGSNCSAFRDRNRFHHPDDNTACNQFRCKNCKRVVGDSFIPNPNINDNPFSVIK